MSLPISIALLAVTTLAPGADEHRVGDLDLAPGRVEGIAGPAGHALAGTFTVYEDRAAEAGRSIDLRVVVLPALVDVPRLDPVFVLAGGPGQAATSLARIWARSWMRSERDIVLVDQRGTGASNPLPCPLFEDGVGLQGWLEPLFVVERLSACRDELAERADLTLYTTPIAMDDLDEVRAALGYERINVYGGSYGTRAGLVYLRRHGDRVRTAILMGVAPIAFENPLHHARSAQDALDGLLAACEGDPDCRSAFPELRGELDAVFARLDEGPVTLEADDPAGGGREELRLSRDGFGEALRLLMYTPAGATRLPLLLHLASEGDYEPFVEAALAQVRGLAGSISLGMLLCVICSEDVTRIEEEEIEPATRGTFLGDRRVRREREVCAIWPRGRVPEGYGEPVVTDVPTLLLSGTLDPVTPPRFAEAVARRLPHALHVVVPGFHGVRGPCIDSIVRQVLESGSVDDIDVSCTERVRLPGFELPH